MGDESVVIVGGGITGLSSAAALAPDHEVTLLERDALANDTTARASGVISLPLEPFEAELIEFIQDRLHSLDDEWILSVSTVPAIRLLEDESTAELGGEHLDIDELHDRFPASFGPLDGYTGGAVFTGAYTLDPLDLAMVYKRAAEANDATILRDRPVEGLTIEDGSVTGVETPLGLVEADQVVYATGWRVTEQLAEHVTIPTRPMRWNALVIEHELPNELPIGSDPRHRLYWRPYGEDHLLVGGNEHLVDDPDTAEATVDPGFRTLVETHLTNLLDLDSPLNIIREDCCPTADSASPDGMAIIDTPTDGPEGLVVATGFHGRGIMLSPATGPIVRACITGESLPFDLDPFSLDRLEHTPADFTYVSHWI